MTIANHPKFHILSGLLKVVDFTEDPTVDVKIIMQICKKLNFLYEEISDTINIKK